MRGGQLTRADARAEISTRRHKHPSLWRRADNSTNNKLKARDWEGEVFCKVVGLAGLRLRHSLFSCQRLSLSVAFLSNGSHLRFPKRLHVSIPVQRYAFSVPFPLNGRGAVLRVCNHSLEAFPLDGAYFRPNCWPTVRISALANLIYTQPRFPDF